MSILAIGRLCKTTASCAGCIIESVATRPPARDTQGRIFWPFSHLAAFFGRASLAHVLSCALGPSCALGTARSCSAADAKIAGLSSCEGAGELGRVYDAASCPGESANRFAQSAASCA